MRRMPFGRHRGKPLAELPTPYLRWLHRECDLREPLKSEVAAEYDSRNDGRIAEQPTVDLPADTESIIRVWYRELVFEHHPDRGGSHAVMAALTDAKKRLEKLIAEAMQAA